MSVFSQSFYLKYPKNQAPLSTSKWKLGIWKCKTTDFQNQVVN